MKGIIRCLLACMVCFLLVSAVLAKKSPKLPPASIGGVYDNITAGAESGDLGGMRVAIFAAGGAWRAVVQIAQGGAEDPKPHFVDVTAKGMAVEFTVEGQTYKGTVSAAGLRLAEVGLLRRKACAKYFSVGP